MKPRFQPRSLFAVLMTALIPIYVLCCMPYFRHLPLLKQTRHSLQWAGWKTDWKMFAPGPHQAFPVQFSFVYDLGPAHAMQEEMVFNVYRSRTSGFFKGVVKTHWVSFYSRLFGGFDCTINCERMLDQAVKQFEQRSGTSVQGAKIVVLWTELDPMEKKYVEIEDVKHLRINEFVRLEKKYVP